MPDPVWCSKVTNDVRGTHPDVVWRDRHDLTAARCRAIVAALRWRSFTNRNHTRTLVDQQLALTAVGEEDLLWPRRNRQASGIGCNGCSARYIRIQELLCLVCRFARDSYSRWRRRQVGLDAGVALREGGAGAKRAP